MVVGGVAKTPLRRRAAPPPKGWTSPTSVRTRLDLPGEPSAPLYVALGVAAHWASVRMPKAEWDPQPCSTCDPHEKDPGSQYSLLSTVSTIRACGFDHDRALHATPHLAHRSEKGLRLVLAVELEVDHDVARIVD